MGSLREALRRRSADLTDDLQLGIGVAHAKGVDLLIEEAAALDLQEAEARERIEEQHHFVAKRHAFEGKGVEIGRACQGFQPILGQVTAVEVEVRQSRK